MTTKVDQLLHPSLYSNTLRSLDKYNTASLLLVGYIKILKWLWADSRWCWLFHTGKMERFQNTWMQPNIRPWLSKLANGSIFRHPRTGENGGQGTSPTLTHAHTPACTYATHKPFYSIPAVQSTVRNEIVKTSSTANCFERSLYSTHPWLDTYRV